MADENTLSPNPEEKPLDNGPVSVDAAADAAFDTLAEGGTGTEEVEAGEQVSEETAAAEDTLNAEADQEAGLHGVEPLDDAEVDRLEALRIAPKQMQRIMALPKIHRAAALDLLDQQAAGAPGGHSEQGRETIAPVTQEALLKQLLRDPDPAVVKELAEAGTIPEAVVSKLLNAGQRGAVEGVLPLMGQLAQALSTVATHVRTQERNWAARYVRQELGAKYPQLADGEKFKKVVDNKATDALVDAYVKQGMGFADATEKAVRERIVAEFGATPPSRTPQRAEQRKTSLRGTPEPSGARRPVSPAVDIGKMTMDQALDHAYNLLQKQKSGSK